VGSYRPFAVWIGGRWEQGLEVEFAEGRMVGHRATSQAPDPMWLSPAFVNAHSHLEYRGWQGQLEGLKYWDWLRELTLRKAQETDDTVREWCRVAARENLTAGVGLIVEHSDRPFSGEALREVGIEAKVLQELITFDEAPETAGKWQAVEERRAGQGAEAITPHATWSVDRDSLSRFRDQDFVSIHVAESVFEAEFFESHRGPIADFYRRRAKALPRQQPILDLLDEVGLLREGVQLVHIGGLKVSEYERLAESGVMIAHCPRSNMNLGCPLPDVRRLLDLGVPVGLGLDSAASSGPIDMLAEIRAMRTREVEEEEAWRIATDASAVGMAGASLPWMALISPAQTLEELISGQPRIQLNP